MAATGSAREIRVIEESRRRSGARGTASLFARWSGRRVTEARRDACLQAVKQFVEAERPVDYVICCRRKEFAELPTRLNIPGEVVLQPLDDLKIGEYLSGDEFAGLPPVWAESAVLREFGRVPFMLNTIAVVTRGKSERQIRLELGTLDDPEPLRDALLEAYSIVA